MSSSTSVWGLQLPGWSSWWWVGERQASGIVSESEYLLKMLVIMTLFSVNAGFSYK